MSGEVEEHAAPLSTPESSGTYPPLWSGIALFPQNAIRARSGGGAFR
jgi:hypothetical protein